MDGLSAAASAMAIVSLAFQLVDTAKQLCDFWSSIKDAPEDIRTVIADLELLTSVLAEMAFEVQHTGPNTTLAKVLQSCTRKLKSLTALTNNLEPGFYSRSSRIRKWTVVKFILKREKLTRFQEVLESLKSTLVLAQQNRHNCMSRLQHETQLGKMTAIAQKLDSLSLQKSIATVTTVSREFADTQDHVAALRAETTRIEETMKDPPLRLGFAVGSERALHRIATEMGTNDAINETDDDKLDFSPSEKFISEKSMSFFVDQSLAKQCRRKWYTINYSFGTIHAYSTTKQLQLNILNNQELDDAEYRYEHESSFTIRPAPWLVKLGLNSGLRVGLFNSSIRGWKSSLRTFSAVPNDSLIFDLSEDGNVPAVRDLFARGLASVGDTNSMGETPLHVATARCHPELCKFLIAAGADKSLRSEYFWWNYYSPIMGACWFSTDKFQLSTTMDTIRLFKDEIHFAEADDDGWAVLICIYQLCSRWEADRARYSAKLDLFVWVLDLYSQAIRENLVESHYAHLLRSAFWPGREKVAGLLLDLGPVGAIDAVVTEGGFTALQVGLLEPGCPDLERILAFNPDIHHLGFDPSRSPVQETPLSLALYASQPFQRFADALNRRNTDLDDFVLQELREHSPLMKDGWTRHKLRALFDHDFEPDVGYTGIKYCDECRGDFIEAVPVEIAWQYHLKEWHLRTASETRTSHTDLVGRSSEDTIQDHTLMGPMQDFGDVGNSLELRSMSSTDCSNNISSGSEPAECERESVSFWQHTLVCVHCRQNLKCGLRHPQSAMQIDSAGEDNDSLDDFSPYLFNT